MLYSSSWQTFFLNIFYFTQSLQGVTGTKIFQRLLHEYWRLFNVCSRLFLITSTTLTFPSLCTFYFRARFCFSATIYFWATFYFLGTIYFRAPFCFLATIYFWATFYFWWVFVGIFIYIWLLQQLPKYYDDIVQVYIAIVWINLKPDC